MRHAKRLIFGCLAACLTGTAVAQSGARLDVSHLLAVSKSLREGSRLHKAPSTHSTIKPVVHKVHKAIARKTVRHEAIKLAMTHTRPTKATSAKAVPTQELRLHAAPQIVVKKGSVRSIFQPETQGMTREEADRLDATTPTAKTATSNASGVGVVNYNISMLQEDRTLTMPSNTWFYYFKVMPGVRMAHDGEMEIAFQTSKTLLAREGSMTVVLNGTPVASRYLDTQANVTNWSVPIPTKFIKTGYNEIRVVTRQRTSDGPCRDVDDAGNWVRLTTATKLNLSRVEQGSYSLYSYPFPYLDPIANEAVNGNWTVTSNASAAELGAMLGVASDWGKREPLKALPIQVSTSGSKGYSVGVGLGQGSGDNGSLQVSGDKLSVSGGDAGGLEKARLALSNPELVAQMEGGSAIISNKPEVSSLEQTSKMGIFTLADLGYPSMTLAGIYHQRTTLTVKRPLVTDLGKESFVRFKFRHSASLFPRRSVLSVSLNNLPIGSARLDQTNVSGGVLVARIPVSELAKNSWTFEIGAYHDLELVDCSKVYDDIAWTVIEGTSEFVLEPGKLLGRPYLENFPYMTTKEGKVSNPGTMRLSAKPSDQELTAAAIVAGRAGQSNRYPMAWTVKGPSESGSQDQGSSVMLGYFSEAERFSALKSQLLVTPIGADKFDVNPRVHLLPSAMQGGCLVQAIPSPYKAGGVLYVVMAQDDEAMKRFCNILGDPKRVDELTGEACLITRQGRVVSLVQKNPADVEKEQNLERDRYTEPMKGAALLLGGLVLCVVVWIVGQFRKPKHLR